MIPRNPPPGIIGSNRTMVTPHYAVMPPEGILESRLPGWSDTVVRFHASPALGARFAQALLEIAPAGGTVHAIEDGLEHFVYVLSGALETRAGSAADILEPGGYVYCPSGTSLSLRAGDAPTRAVWIRRPYARVADHATPGVILGRRDQVERQRRHTDGRTWQHLLPDDDLAFDMAINILSFAPGTHFPFVETHIMEHGLFMLQGQGLYLLGRDWHECWTNDFIWMGPYVPQQFYCTGWEEAAYLLYKDVNRDVQFAP